MTDVQALTIRHRDGMACGALADDKTWGRFEHQVAAAAPAVMAVMSVCAVWVAVLGAVLQVLEGVQQLSQWQTNWVLYRSPAEALKRERFLHVARAGPYSPADRHRVLAERIEGLASQEHARWTQARGEPDGAGRIATAAEGKD
jgi:hypothetical protein